MKVPLVKPRPRRYSDWYGPPHSKSVHWTSSLPFFVSPARGMIHRPRSVTCHISHGVHTHTSVSFWCGACGFLEWPDNWPHHTSRNRHKGNRLTDSPGDGHVFCSTCEGRAVGAGQLGSAMLAGRMVIFSPREGRLAV